MIDLHAHILPGVDDGARTIQDSREMAQRAAGEGVSVIAATPHIRADYATTPDRMEAGVQAVREDFAAVGIDVDVLHGAEVDLEMLNQLAEGDVDRFTIAQGGRYLLLEFPYVGWPLGLDQIVSGLKRRGLTPILAHPERNRDVQENPARLQMTVAAGALVQITAASLDGRLGPSSRKAGLRLLELELAHVLASDAHGPGVREAGLLAAAKAVGDDRLARYLTEEVPAAIVAGEPPPGRPTRKRRRFEFF